MFSVFFSNSDTVYVLFLFWLVLQYFCLVLLNRSGPEEVWPLLIAVPSVCCSYVCAYVCVCVCACVCVPFKINLWLLWVSVAVCGLSLVASSRGSSDSRLLTAVASLVGEHRL